MGHLERGRNLKLLQAARESIFPIYLAFVCISDRSKKIRGTRAASGAVGGRTDHRRILYHPRGRSHALGGHARNVPVPPLPSPPLALYHSERRDAGLKRANRASEPSSGAFWVPFTICWHAWASAAAAADKLVPWFTGWEGPWKAVGHGSGMAQFGTDVDVFGTHVR